MKIFKIFPIVFISLIFLQACKKEKVEDTIKTDNPAPVNTGLNAVVTEENKRFDALITRVNIKAVIQGYVLDETGLPVAGATLAIGNNAFATNDAGYFSMGEISLNSKFAVLMVKKSQFLTNIKTITVLPNSFNTLKINLLRRNMPAKFVSSAGGNLDLEGGKIKLNFPVSALVSKDGTKYTGAVNAYARYISPSAENLTSIMPGALSGLTSGNQITGLVSYGMVSVELEDNSGNKLEVASDSKVQVSLPAGPNDPTTLPIWHFNETYGLWVEAGTATKQGNTYSFEANCFSSWNIDAYGGNNDVTITLQNQNGDPLSNMDVELFTSDFNNALKQVYTDNNGSFSLINCPQNIGVRIRSQCGAFIDKTIGIGNGSAVITISDNDLNDSKTYTFSGIVKDCNNQPYANSFISLTGINAPQINLSGKTDANGNYSMSGMFCNISSTVPYAVKAEVQLTAVLRKTDTLLIVFNNSNINKNLDFCSAAITNDIFNKQLIYGNMTDIDGNTYRTIQIGSQTWMAENLKTSRYRDGSPISYVTQNAQWQGLNNGGYSYYNNDPAHNSFYGKLYNWHAVNTGMLAPAGWHIATEAEWNTLINYLGGSSMAGDRLKSATALWTPYSGITHSNSSGFSGLPCGYRGGDGGFSSITYYGYYWSGTLANANSASAFVLDFSQSSVANNNYFKNLGLSVRCVKD